MSEAQAGIDPLDRRLTDPKHVFGWKTDKGNPNVEGFDRDPKTGKPIEHGLGAPGYETAQHYQAILKHGKPAEQTAAQAALDVIMAGKGLAAARKAFAEVLEKETF